MTIGLRDPAEIREEAVPVRDREGLAQFMRDRVDVASGAGRDVGRVYDGLDGDPVALRRPLLGKLDGEGALVWLLLARVCISDGQEQVNDLPQILSRRGKVA